MNRALATVGGLVLFGAHVVALPALVDGCRKDELSVRLTSAPVAATLDLAGEVPASLASEVAFSVDGTGPGLHYAQWSMSYGGGFTRRVGAAQLVGPFQDPAHPPCGARLVVGQRLLDDGTAGPGTIAAMVEAGVVMQMAGFEQFPAGEFERVKRVGVTWARFDDHLDPPSMFGNPVPDATTVFQKARHTDGYARVEVVVELTRVTATVTVAMVPMIKDGALDLAIYLRAEIETGVDAIDWVLDKLPIDDYVTKTIREQIDGALITAFEPPPPLPLPGGRALTFSYCPDAYLAMRSGAWAGLPLAVAFEGPAGAQALPPRLGPAAPASVPDGTSIAFDLDLDTLNAILFELWRTKFLDEQLAAAKLDQRFAEDPTVRDLLTLRISPLTLALPPVVTQGPHGLRMAADLRVALRDGDAVTPARVWGTLDVGLGGKAADVGLADLQLACEPEPGLLRPCYGDLVDAMRARAPDVRAQLSGVLTTVLDDLFTGRRVSAEDQPAELVLGPPTTTTKPAGASATIRVALDGRLDPVPM